MRATSEVQSINSTRKKDYETRFFKHFVLAGLIAVWLAAPLHAESEAETRNLFKTAGSKQTSKDFSPAPDKIKTNFGTLKFEGGAFPTDASVQKIYDEMDLQRATQAYMDFFPALSLYGIVSHKFVTLGSDIFGCWGNG